MNRIGAVGALASVVAGGLLYSHVRGQARPLASAQPVADAAPAQPRGVAADVPIREVVLFSSGVGYFEHFGSVKGNASADLRFKTDQINDVLKSLLLQDMDGGTVGAVSYAGQAPLDRTLKSFGVDITDNPTMATLLNQLRGARLSVDAGASHYTGTIIGVEKKTKAINTNGDAIETAVLNLKEGDRFRSIPLDQTQSIELDNPKLQAELDEALGVVAKSRDQDKKPVTIHFRGKGERRVRIGYVVETPVWKTSYRLVLDDPHDAAAKPAGPGAKAPGDEIHDNSDRDAPDAERKNPQPDPKAGAKRAASAKLQGWAIVENQTDNDWKDVRLSLISGQPLSFIQDLYHSRYIPRPVVESDTYASLVPQTYAGGVSKEELEKMNKAKADADANATQGGQNQSQANTLFDSRPMGAGGQGERIDPTSSIVAAASAGRVGELFEYSIPNVSLARQQAAMIPIVTENVSARKVSIYDGTVLSDHPLLGARLKNNTKKYLLAGPITVLDEGAYAGDARIEDLPPGQARLISYGIDQEVLIDASHATQNDHVLTAYMDKGVLWISRKSVSEQMYLLDNKSDRARTLIIQHPRLGDGWKLVTPKAADETTPTLLRFQRKLQPHATDQLNITAETTTFQDVKLLSQSTENLAGLLKIVGLPQKVREALTKAVQMRTEVAAIDAHMGSSRGKIAEITAEQSRIRENLKSVSPQTDYYNRLVKELDSQETELAKVHKEITDAQTSRDALQKQLDEYLANLAVKEPKSD